MPLHHWCFAHAQTIAFHFFSLSIESDNFLSSKYSVLNCIVSKESFKMAEEFKGKHVVIFSRSCLFLSSKDQQQMNEEIDALSENGNFELHFTSHRNPTSEMLGAIPKA